MSEEGLARSGKECVLMEGDNSVAKGGGTEQRGGKYGVMSMQSLLQHKAGGRRLLMMEPESWARIERGGPPGKAYCD